jgi:hypothetical protein
VKHTQDTRVFVAGKNISGYVKSVNLHRVPGEPTTAEITVYVDRLSLDDSHAVTQVLEIHIAEEK